ncbi:putative alpha-ketoglutarate-dependent sulfonate dioxygenase [Seiridium cardinale]
MAVPEVNGDVAKPVASPSNTNGTIPEIKKTFGGLTQSASYSMPLTYSGTLDHYESFDVTAVIGREFPKLQLTDILNDDAKIRDLAIIVSERGVVFFRRQDIGIEEQKILGQKLGELTGKPKTSKLHKHTLINSKDDDEVSIVSSEQQKKFYQQGRFYGPRRLASEGWHADITFERVPSDYAVLKITQKPDDVGGDTLWASGYEAFDRLSPIWQRFAEGLTATHHEPNFTKLAAKFDMTLLEEDRGAPENKGVDFAASHPVVRTNPVTGWKSLFAVGHQIHNGWIDNVTETESELIKAYFLNLIAENHDLQVRFRWNENDVAIWDNRSVFHTGTNDFQGKRQGNRVVSLGEKPFYNPASKSRREALFRTL